ncbi:FAD-binding oxidoreductase [Antrihabitans cavernicola]|uniref:FAD-binding oxidoreductase n=1 Tax=Antrihabitans cavernicola TaxID=2495913 RepID=A0A5A7SA49_9NOCA|nr:FAD-binding oxidoreductase [Spelaeibacter cavernicola]KAA0021717.1 FAD-binding oxidoreductase [Spelaeibacter cavernicola]
MTAATKDLDLPVLTPDDDRYDAVRTGFQTYRPHRPDVIVEARNSTDVQSAVRFAAADGLPVAVQSSGHGLATAADGGVLIATGAMADVRIDPTTRTVTAGAGALWKDVITAAAEHGLAPLSGSAPGVGVVGYTLGGGFGILSREFGYACDLVRSIDVVTADGEFHHVTAESDPDLFWALRGGRDNFGIVTAIEIELLEITRLYGGGLYFDIDLIPELLETYRTWTATVPDELTSAVALIPIPDIPAFPEPIRGKYVAHVRIAYTGSAAEGEQLVRPLREVGPILLDTLAEMPYTDCGSIYSDPPFPHSYTGNNAMLRELDPAAIADVFEIVGPEAPIDCVVEIRHLGGAMARKPQAPSAVGHRDAEFVVRVISMVDDDIDEARALHRSLFTALAPWTLGRNINFVYRGDPVKDPIDDAYDDYDRLVELKSAYDPSNMFRLNQNVS